MTILDPPAPGTVRDPELPNGTSTMPSFLALTARKHLPAIALTFIVAVVLVLNSAQPASISTITLIGIYGLMATSLGMIYGQAGMMSLGQASFAALGAYSTAILSVRWELNPLLGLVAAVLIPSMIAYPLARLIVRLSSLALALSTLFLGSAVAILLNQGGDFTGGYLGIGGIPTLAFLKTPVDYTIFVWVCVIIVIILYTNLVKSAAGRALNTLRVDSLRSQADGDRGLHRLSGLFAFAAGLAGLSGWLYAHYMTYLAPESLSVHLSLSLLLMVLVGGSRHVLGPVLGAVVLTYMNKVLPDDMQGLLYGASVILVLIAAPRGIIGTIENIVQRRRPQGATKPPAREPAAVPSAPTIESEDPQRNGDK
ncbi:branched-chain amino acid ABC transporter permease (plasmid) [Rhodococcus qingshengii]|uniref:branched-chain amino acid ABC transporter permease n=1 Tax=Rhodococcus TaxID=1827 RepID=UPI000F620A21|nr:MULTISPECIES: branched-chain amino acid ABC transporter permease [Rhodococcus]AZI65937.1 branched-chain amino acid ABC transporter permease [Rhodococcus sp. NJ-530]BDQ23923.1 branched-chain amino acid ABC transporter permease [Rhodococcus qingshengii]